MQNQDLIRRICAFADSQGAGDTSCPTGIEGLTIIRSHQPKALEAVFYRPLVCLVLQGRKETHLGSHCLGFGAGESLIVSHDVPVLSSVTEASQKRPYVAIVLPLDLNILRDLHDQVNEAEIEEEQNQSLKVGDTDAALLDAIARLFALVDRPVEAKVMAPLLKREIHFRLLSARHGGMLRQLLRRESQAFRIDRAIARIRQDYTKPLNVTELARSAGMSSSSFHEHFKSITAKTPLQYQKELRLLEARRLLLTGTHNVATAAYKVGYQSPSQFSREYGRQFGVSPSKDKLELEAATPQIREDVQNLDHNDKAP